MIPTSVAIGTPLWYFDTSLEYMNTPRAAIVTGVGSNPNTVDVTVFGNPTWDVAEKGKPPLFCRRNLPLFDVHPGHWKVNAFCVYPPFEAQYGGADFVAPMGGTIYFQHPELEAKVSGQATDEPTPESKPAPKPKTKKKKSVPKKKVTPKPARDLPPGESDEAEAPPDDEDDEEFDLSQADEDEEGEEPSPRALPGVTDHALRALIRHPTFIDHTRRLVTEEGFEMVEQPGPPAKLVFSAPVGCQLATVQYINRADRGYRLRAYTKGQNMSIIVRTAASNGDVRMLLTKLNKILECGVKARSKADAKRATRAALRKINPVE